MQLPAKYLARLLLAMLVATFLLPASAWAQRVLRYSDHEPLGGMRTKFINEVFFAAIEKESKGRLRVNAQWDSALATGYDALRVAGEGRSVDMAIVVPEYMAANLPLHQIFKSFPVGPTGARQVAFFRRAYAEIPEFPAELDKNNVHALFFGTGYPLAFFSTRPLETLKDLEGGKWRSASFWHFDFLRNAGASPVTMPWGEGVFKAMQARTLDGLMVNVDSGYMLNVHETAPNVLLSKDLWLGHVYLLVMNKTVWNGLPQEDRDAIQRAATFAHEALGRVMDSSFDAMVRDLQKAGAKVRQLQARELAVWKTTTRFEQIQTRWGQEQENKGVLAAGAVMEKTRVLLHEAMR